MTIVASSLPEAAADGDVTEQGEACIRANSRKGLHKITDPSRLHGDLFASKC